MKTRFVDVRNYHKLLPLNTGLSLASQLDKCLQGINDKLGKSKGAIEKLLVRNERTINQSIGSKRLCASPITVAQIPISGTNLFNTSAIEGPPLIPAILHTTIVYENGIRWKTSVPLQFVLKCWGDADKGFQGYIHTIQPNLNLISNYDHSNSRESKYYDYVGITGRNWLLRLDEHFREMHRGSKTKFHSLWRKYAGQDNFWFSSFLKDINMTFEEAMKWEEEDVDKLGLGTTGLNMIPGGFKGLRFLHKCRIIESTDISLEKRDYAIAEYYRRNPRKGLPNPFIAELWKDDSFYLKVIEAKEKTLSPDQVKSIRLLNKEGKSVSQIVNDVSALNEQQVKNVISGRTYKRIQ
ncbi:MAG: hypothetical protein JW925_12410 [Syntrophaceae bacterium]|nr:hypothetical protein [Syntrophaceae bacterium]